MLNARALALVGAVALATALAVHTPITGQSRSGLVTIAADTPGELRAWDALVDRLARDGELRLRRTWEDTLVAGRRHERFDQYYRGVRVFGGDVARQLDGSMTVSVFGTLYEGIAIDPTPRLSADEARAAIEAAAGTEPPEHMAPELVVVPRTEGGYALAYVGRAFADLEMRVYFVDAMTGTIIRSYSDFQPQVVGKGRGVYNDDKKVSARQSATQYVADDKLRPPAIATYDMRGDFARLQNFLAGRVTAVEADFASDADNNWTDGPNVDAHAYAGMFYDYLFKRFGRRGIDDNNLRIVTFVHPVRLADIWSQPASIVGLYYLNAFYCRTCGSDGRGVVVFGEGAPAGFLPGLTVHSFAGAIDVVAHELTHAVTAYTSRIGGAGEGGSLNEGFSDILGTAVEFFFQPAGNGPLRAEYWTGEDLTVPPGAFVRSLINPAESGHPDHYSRRNPARGIHFNSTILGHAFYLAIEGGANRTSGLAVRGVGAANRDQIEKVFFRAFAFLMPSAGTFALARVATIQAARDLYGAGSTAERAVTEAWDAVGVQERTSPSVSFSPNPVPASRSSCGGVTPSWFFTTTVSAASSGLTVNRWSISFLDGDQSLINRSDFAGVDFPRFFFACGPPSQRVPPQADACTSLCVNLGGRASGFVSFSFDAVDDGGRVVSLTSERLRLLALPGTVTTTESFGPAQFQVTDGVAGR